MGSGRLVALVFVVSASAALGCTTGSDVCVGVCASRDASVARDVQLTGLQRDTGPDRVDAGGPSVCAPRCEPGQTCIGGACCANASACGGACCGEGQVCSFERCIAPGALCRDSSECDATEYCNFAAQTPPGDVCVGSPEPTGRCVLRPPTCDLGGTPGATCLDRCVYAPDTFSFEPVVRYRWPDPFHDTTPGPFVHDATVMPIVVQLDDDNCDGVTNTLDLPDIVVTTFLNNPVTVTIPGTLHALTVRDGRLQEKWSFPGVIPGYGQLAGGQFHPSPGGEVIACGSDGTVLAVSSTGTLLWRSTPIKCRIPALGDLNQDGKVEVVVEGGVLDAETGRISHTHPLRGSFVLSDIDDDGRLDVVGGLEAFDGTGAMIASTGNTIATEGGLNDQVMPAVVDLDLDGKPEIAVVVPFQNQFSLWRYSASTASHAEVIRTPFVAVVPGSPRRWGVPTGMGPITSGDFNGDGRPDLAYTGFLGYVVLDGAKLMDAGRPSTLTPEGVLLWKIPTEEDNGSTGSAVFDFNGDGRVEVLYNATDRLHILSAATGESLGSICNTASTIYEYPVVADVDGDGEANVIIVANAYVHGGSSPSYECDGTWQSGLRVLGSRDGSWVRASRVWNQHSYHVTNVDEVGNIPREERANWRVPGLNNFRQNRQPGTDYAAPDATVAIRCESSSAATVVVSNLGESLLPAGVQVDVLDASGAIATTLTTTRNLYPAESQVFEDVSTGTWDGSGTAPRAVIRAGSVPRDCNARNDRADLVCVI